MRLSSDPRFEPTFSQLIDFTAASDVSIGTSTIHQLARLSPFGRGTRRAVVAGSDIVYGMARMFQVLREPIADQVQVFTAMSPSRIVMESGYSAQYFLIFLSMDRHIIGFHQDAESHWVADLECGHTQHVRHEPPWQNRPWVLDPETRNSHPGTILPCRHCAQTVGGELPTPYTDARMRGVCEDGASEAT